MKLVTLVYENGVFRPEEPVALSQGDHVKLPLPETPEDSVALEKLRAIGGLPFFDHETAEELRRIIAEGKEERLEAQERKWRELDKALEGLFGR